MAVADARRAEGADPADPMAEVSDPAADLAELLAPRRLPAGIGRPVGLAAE